MQILENEFCLEVLRSFVTGDAPPAIPEELNWDRLERMQVLNNLEPVFFHVFRSVAVPESRRQQWKRKMLNVMARNLKMRKVTARLFKALDDGQIPAVVLRGMALLQDLYPNPGLRPMHDVDVLVPIEARNRLVPHLRQHGLVPSSVLRGQYVYEIDGVMFEIHFYLLTPRRYRAMAAFQGWLDSRQRVSTPEGAFDCLPPERELLELVCHAFIHHELDRLLPLVDLALLVKKRNLDWPYLREWCRQAHLSRMVAFTLGYVDHIFRMGQKDTAALLGVQLPHNIAQVFDAYTACLMEADNRSHFFRRKKNMLFVAEQPVTKLKQWIRFFGKRDLSAIWHYLRPGRNMAKRHIEGCRELAS